MMANIPSCRDWRVRFYDGNKVIVDVVVNTINKRFARWMANEQNGYPAIRSTRVTVSPIRETITVCAYRGIVDRKVWPA